jgi:hypothetical protein
MKKTINILSVLILVLFSSFTYSQCPSGYTVNGTNQVANSNFSQGNTGFTSQYTYEADQDLHTECWAEATYSIVPCAYDVHSMWSHSTKAVGDSGVFMVVNGASVANVKIWEEHITVTPNTTYYFTTWVCSVHPLNPAILQFYVGGITGIGNITATSDTNNYWQQFYATWNSGAATTADISIINKNTTANGNDFGLDDIYFIPCKLSLPVEFLEVTAKVDKDHVNVSWSTASETNNNYFTVERSVDGMNFKPLGNVKGAGNSNTVLSYNYTDNNPATGVSYYRIKQTDFNGNFKYSEIVYIKYLTSGLVYSIYPNPVKSGGDLMIVPGNSTEESYSVSIYSSFGQKISDYSCNGVFSIPIENSLGKGIYYVKISSAGYTQTNKIAIE